MLIILIGKTSSGKTLIREKLSAKGYKPLVTWTTRPMRDDEKDGVDYHFVSEEEFFDLKGNGFFAETKCYETVFGKWYYGCSIKEYDCGNACIILTPDGLRDILWQLKDIDYKAIYVYSNNETIRRRLKLRGDNKEEAERRISHDNEDFKGIEFLVDKIIYNNEEDNIDEVVEKILKVINK